MLIRSSCVPLINIVKLAVIKNKIQINSTFYDNLNKKVRIVGYQAN